jgi:hypothetical protein
MIRVGYDIYDRFTMEHFPLRQSMILTTSFFARDSTSKNQTIKKKRSLLNGRDSTYQNAKKKEC